MRIIEFDKGDSKLIDAVFAIRTASHIADAPGYPPPTYQHFTAGFTRGWPGWGRRWLTAVEGSDPVGFASLIFWLDSNTDGAYLRLDVHPDHRRRGVGSALLDRAAAIAGAEGRGTLTAEAAVSFGGGPVRSEVGARFLEARGFSRIETSIVLQGRVAALDPASEDRLHADAVAASGEDYELRQWVGRVPEDLLTSVCRLNGMIVTEVPLGEVDREVEEPDIGKMRVAEAVTEAEGRVRVHTVAIDRMTGEAVAWNNIIVDEGRCTVAHQSLTAVAPAHRGRRLGLLVKLVNLRQLRERFDQVEATWSDVGEDDAAIIAINRTLGFETVGGIGEFQRRLTTAGEDRCDLGPV